MGKFVLALLLIPLLCACAGAKSENSEQESAIPDSDADSWSADFGRGGKWGYEDSLGNTMIPFKFAYADDFSNGVAVVRKTFSGDSYLIDKSGEVISEGFDHFNRQWGDHIIGERKDENGVYQRYYVNNSGKTVFGPYQGIKGGRDPDVLLLTDSCDTCGFYETKHRLIHRKGRFLGPWYAYLSETSWSYFYTATNFDGDDSRDVAVNWRGEVISKWYDDIGAMPHTYGFNRTRSKGEESWNYKGAIDSTGTEIVPPNYWMVDYHPGQKVFSCEKKKGTDERYDLYSTTAKLLKSNLAKEPYFPENSSLICMELSSKSYCYYRLIDDDLEKITDSFQKKRYERSYAGKNFWGRYKSGTRVSYGIPQFHDGLAIVIQSGKSGYIDLDGNLVIATIFNEANDFEDGQAKVKLNGREFQIDTAGNEIPEPER